MNFENSISLNFPAIMLETFETLKRFIFPKFHETLQPYTLKNIPFNFKKTLEHMRLQASCHLREERKPSSERLAEKINYFNSVGSNFTACTQLKFSIN